MKATKLIAVLAALTLIVLASFPGAARPPDGTDYRAAFATLNGGNAEAARIASYRGPDVVLNKVLRGALMALPGNEYSFDEMASFIADNPGWPNLKNIMMIAGQSIPRSYTPQQTVNWFNANPPANDVSFYAYVDAMNAAGQADTAAQFVRARWISRDFPNAEAEVFRSRYASLLTRKDHWDRLDRLVWDHQASAARAMEPLVDEGHRALAEARLVLDNPSLAQPDREKTKASKPSKGSKPSKKSRSSKKAAKTAKPKPVSPDVYVSRVPANLRNDPGLLYERLKVARKANKDDLALSILEHAPDQLVRPDAWWDERHILARRLIEEHNYARAYHLVADHGLATGFDYLQAEFLAGWLALRFAKHPELALRHFQNLDREAGTPMSRSRAEYWLARTYEALGNARDAQESYETAATLSTTFYGQLAAAKLSKNPTIRAMPEPAIPGNVRDAFFARDMVQAVEHLGRIGETTRALAFFKANLDTATQRYEYALLMELAYRLQRPDWAINAAKAANQKNFVVGAGAYPLLSNPMPSPPDPAFTHALIRQESLFNTDARSPAGARGLMQLLPSTARDVARREGVTYHESRLNDPDYNLKLGTAFVQDQLDRFGGSAILALAGYNAGPGRVHEWIGMFGDPRSGGVDPIDWIELMPIYETRNYVQRIIENTQMYRARLSGGQAPLRIMQDLGR